jgi:hypothetical protein
VGHPVCDGSRGGAARSTNWCADARSRVGDAGRAATPRRRVTPNGAPATSSAADAESKRSAPASSAPTTAPGAPSTRAVDGRARPSAGGRRRPACRRRAYWKARTRSIGWAGAPTR